jgi:hypothetical protein
MLLHLLFVWETSYEEATRAERKELVELLPIELSSSLATMTAINARSL